MASRLKDLLTRAESWPETAQDELVRAGLEIEAEQRAGAYRPTFDELQAIDEALTQVERGEMASAREIEAAFAKLRG